MYYEVDIVDINFDVYFSFWGVNLDESLVVDEIVWRLDIDIVLEYIYLLIGWYRIIVYRLVINEINK
jgi:hypothetical protein